MPHQCYNTWLGLETILVSIAEVQEIGGSKERGLEAQFCMCLEALKSPLKAYDIFLKSFDR